MKQEPAITRLGACEVEIGVQDLELRAEELRAEGEGFGSWSLGISIWRNWHVGLEDVLGLGDSGFLGKPVGPECAWGVAHKSATNIILRRA